MSFNLKEINWEEFKNPPTHAQPMVRWWWTGLDVEKEELIKEVQELDEAGFLGAEIQVFMIGSPLDLEKRDKERAARSHRLRTRTYRASTSNTLYQTDDTAQESPQCPFATGTGLPWPHILRGVLDNYRSLHCTQSRSQSVGLP